MGSLLVGNPHFPWEGELRFAEVHLTVPGELDIYGAQLVGLPGVGIGFNEGVAWSHTVSAGKRMTAYLLTLDPESPTSYLVDGVSTPMTSTDYTIDILRADGTVDSETRTLWRSEYGPILDFPGLGWTETAVLTYRDANIDNTEFIEQYIAMAQVDSLDGLIEVQATFQGIPLFNTIAAGSDGRVWYADTAATPNLSAEAEALFLEQLETDPVTQIGYDNGVVVLDGSDSLFRWEVVPGARDPASCRSTRCRRSSRTDYVFNANDSYWVPSDEFRDRRRSRSCTASATPRSRCGRDRTPLCSARTTGSGWRARTAFLGRRVARRGVRQHSPHRAAAPSAGRRRLPLHPDRRGRRGPRRRGRGRAACRGRRPDRGM